MAVLTTGLVIKITLTIVVCRAVFQEAEMALDAQEA